MSATIDLTLLASFVAVAESSSFSLAAQRLGVTTATVSRSIARLEDLVGAQLLHRTTRRVSLSTAGEALFERAAPHIGALRSAVDSLPEGQEEPAGVLRLTAPYDLGVTLLGEVVARFTSRYPEVSVEADFTNRNVDILAERFDLAIRGDAGTQPNSSLTVRRVIRRAGLRFCAAPTYIARRGTPRAAWSSDHDWLVFGPMHKKLDVPSGFEPRIIANDFLFLREATRAGAGVGALPAFIADALVASGDLVTVLPGLRPSVGGLIMLFPGSGPLPRKVAAFRDLFVASLKKHEFE